MKNNKSPGIDSLTGDVFIFLGGKSAKQITTILYQILNTEEIWVDRKETKMTILHKTGDKWVFENYRPISLLSHMFTQLLQKWTGKDSDENQPREQAGFRKGYLTVDYLQTINQLIEKWNRFNMPLCIGHIDYEKAFDTIEHTALF